MNYNRTSIRNQLLGSKLLFPALALIAIVIGFGASSAMADNKPRLTAVSCQGICVNLEPNGINPGELAVKTGEFVQFNTADNQKHNLALGAGHSTNAQGHSEAVHDSKGEYESGEFGKGEAWRVQFKQPGVYSMFDRNFPDHKILVVVYTPKNN